VQVFGSKHSIQAHTIQQRKQEARQAGRQAGRQDGRQVGRQAGGQAETRGDKTSGRRTHHPTQAHMRGDNGRQSETDKGRQDLGKDTIQHRHICRETLGDNGRQGETRGDKTSGRRTHHLTQARMWGDNGRQRETRQDKTRPWEGGHTIQHRHACGETMGDKRRQADTPSNTGTLVGRQWETMGDKGRQGGRRPREGGHTIQHQGGHRKKALRTPNSTLFGELYG